MSVRIIKCPYCNSDEIRRQGYSARGFAIGVLLIGVPFLFRSRNYFCFDCGNEFKKGQKPIDDLNK